MYHHIHRLLEEGQIQTKIYGTLFYGSRNFRVALSVSTILFFSLFSRIWNIFAGIHRLLDHRESLEQASVLVVVAGMEGALPSVVAGMVSKPVIAVPTSVGYGASLGGLTALFAMLNSCSSNVAVVNIDNGFGAGYMAAIINRE